MIQNEIYNYIFSKFQNETAIDGIANNSFYVFENTENVCVSNLSITSFYQYSETLISER